MLLIFRMWYNKSKKVAKNLNVDVNFIVQDLIKYKFIKKYNVILFHGVLHLPE